MLFAQGPQEHRAQGALLQFHHHSIVSPVMLFF
jgi:hypothetical protein